MSITAPCAHASMGTDRRSILSAGYRLQQRRWRIYKRTLDIACSSFLILALLFLMVAIAAAIKFDSKGPIIFRQRRRGCGGGYFMCYKFRTMHAKFTDSEARVQSRRNDERITKVGGFLRKTSLDELPQLFNVLLGDMSLVGPRPHAPGTNVDGCLLPDIAENYLLRYSVKPGITGWAQVQGSRGILGTKEGLNLRLSFDFYYILNWSPMLDLRILLATLGCFFDEQAF
jgi:polysaccharide biosynthesis protein PslA